MRLLLRTDTHWSEYSSIIRDMGDKYSIRLEHCINSINWSERLAEEKKCDEIIDLGDFFDTNKCTDTEITALSEIQWAKLPHRFLVGNHEISSKDREINSVNIFRLLGFDIITEPKMIEDKNFTLCYLPYMFEFPTISELFPTDKERIIFSHNNIIDKAFAKEGVNPVDIKNNCRLFLNGHLHNKFTDGNIIVLGNFTGQNFSEDNINRHYAYILDTDTCQLEKVENPYAFNFYKIKYGDNIKLRPNAVISINCKESEVEAVKEKYKDCIAIKINIIPEIKKVETQDIIKINHLQSLVDYMIDKFGDSKELQEELSKIIQ